MPGPLDGVRVVEVCDLRGAMCARLLADLGADVVAVRSPRVGAAEMTTTAYRYRNANKRGTVLDLHEASGRARLHELLADADVLVENIGRRRSGAHELDPASVAARHPHLVHVALTDLGLDGARADWHLEPIAALAASGGLWATGFPGRPPCWLPGHLVHDCASTYGAVGAVAALLERSRTGRGQLVEVSAQEAGMAGLNPWAVATEDYRRVNPHLNPAVPRNADGAYWVLPAKDGWVRTVIGSQRQWQGFVALCGNPDALTGPEWQNPGFRLMNLDVIRIVAHECLADRTRAELFAQSLALGTTLGVLHTPSEFVAHEQTAHREFFASTGFGGLGDAPFATSPLRLSATPASLRLAAPGPADGDAGFGPRADGAGPALTWRAPVAASGLLLDGVRVVEFGMAAVVPELCTVLSELGAEVIKVESLAHPDVLRTSGMGTVDTMLTFNCESRGRKSMTVDLTGERGRALALDLCATADVVCENYRGGVLERLGLGYEGVRAVNPDVVYVSSQGYGQGGPFGEMPAFGPLNAGFAGLHFRWSDPDAPYPCGTSLNHPDHIAGKLLAVATLAALGHRDRTGEGQLVEMAQTEAAAYFLGEMYLDAALTGVEPGMQGNRSDTAAPHGVYRCAGDDRWVAIAVRDDDAWHRLCRALGWPDDPALATLAPRIAARDELDRRLEAWTATVAPDEAAEQLQRHGVSAMPVMGPIDHHADAHLAQRGFIVELQHPVVGVEHHVGNPLRLHATPQRTAASAPCLGADTLDVLTRVLGYHPAEAEALVADGTCR